MQTTNISKSNSCNYGIDLLRLFAMYMVVVLHVLGAGGVLSTASGSAERVAWLIETAAYCAVDCFAMISGYVSYREKPKPYHYSKFISFWIPIFFYNFGITLTVYLLRSETITLRQLLKSAVPISSGAYWYASAYAGLFFLIPWINRLLHSLDNKETTEFISMIVLVFIVYVTFANYFDGKTFGFSNGYSFAWLVILFLVGAWIKKCDIPSKTNNLHLIAGIVICVLFSWSVHEFVDIVRFNVLFVDYTSFTIVFIAFALVCIFAKLQLNPLLKKLTVMFARAAFGVYLIHVQSIIFTNVIGDAFTWIASSPIWLIPLQVLGSALCIFIICLLIEKIRLLLFQYLGINKLLNEIEKKADSLIEKSNELLKCVSN